MNRQKPEDVIGAVRPFTGAEYLESLRDGRELRLDRMLTQPFRNEPGKVDRSA